MADLQLYIGIILTLGICIVLVTALFYYSRQRFAILEHSHKEQAMILHEFITTTSRDVDGMKHMLMNVSFPYFQNQQHSQQSQQSSQQSQQYSQQSQQSQHHLYRDQINSTNNNEKKLIHISSDEEDSDSDNDSHISESSMTSNTTSENEDYSDDDDDQSNYSNDEDQIEDINNESEPMRLLLHHNKIYIGGFHNSQDEEGVIELKDDCVSDDMSSSELESDYDSDADASSKQQHTSAISHTNPVLDSNPVLETKNDEVLDQVHVIKIDQPTQQQQQEQQQQHQEQQQQHQEQQQQKPHPSSSNNSNKKNIHIVNLDDNDDESHKPHPQEEEHAPHNLASLQSYTAVSVGELRQYIKEHLSPEKLEELGISELNKIKKAQLVKIVQDMKSA